MKVIIASDHGGFALKKQIIEYLEKVGYPFQDMGTFDEKSVDYPDIARVACEKILEDKGNRGVLVCGTGIGISIAANRFRGIRAGLVGSDEKSVEVTKFYRQHNDGNALCLGGRFNSIETVIPIIETYLNTKAEYDRHEKRRTLLDQMGPYPKGMKGGKDDMEGN